MSGAGMREFWDERARENAAYFVDNRLDYNEPQMDTFWAEGPSILDECLSAAKAPAIEPTDVVVEVGCGIGRLTRPLSERASKVYAIDVSEEMLARARNANPQLPNVEWILGDGDRLTGVPDASADVVVSHVVFQHIPDSSITLSYVRDMGRVLKPGGWAAFGISNDPQIHRPAGGLTGLRVKIGAMLGRAPRKQDHPAWIGSAVDIGDLRAAAAEGGLEVERLTGEGTQYCWPLLIRR